MIRKGRSTASLEHPNFGLIHIGDVLELYPPVAILGSVGMFRVIDIRAVMKGDLFIHSNAPSVIVAANADGGARDRYGNSHIRAIVESVGEGQA